MIASTLAAFGMWNLEQMQSALSFAPRLAAVNRWVNMPGMPGRLRFYPASGGLTSLANKLFLKTAGRVPFLNQLPLYRGADASPTCIVGYGAGNVPGTALIITLLGLCSVLTAGKPPVVIVRNSRREPIFSTLVLQALAEADPALLSTVAVLVWDYENAELQQNLLSQADLVIAAAGDDTIAQLEQQIAAARRPVRPRFHPHGHKVSFSVVGKEMFRRDLDLCDLLSAESSSAPLPPPLFSSWSLLDMVTMLAALDSA
ncbi:MAG: hypothetical protein H5T84_07485, partial [Thermoleophilia bacterium]|nr:hypothetical protein [Thermoleophilia bacterium]